LQLDWDHIHFWSKNRKHASYAALIWLISRPARLKPLRYGMFRLLLTLSPVMPVTLTRGIGPHSRGGIFVWAGLIAFTMALLVNVLINHLNGTLRGHDPAVVYFLDDIVNLILYSAVVPAYVGCAAVIISLYLEKHAEISERARDLGRVTSFSRRQRFPVFILLTLCIGSLFTYGYIRDVLGNMDAEQVFWFAEAIGNDRIVLNGAGIYYVLLNFMLLTLLVIAAFCFFSMFFEAFNVGMSLGALQGPGTAEFSSVETTLLAYGQAYLWAKIICLILCLNIVVWSFSPLSETDNYAISIVVVGLLGLFFVSFPRYYIEIMWRSFLIRSGAVAQYADFPDVRPNRDRVVVQVADYLLVFILFSVLLKVSTVWTFLLGLLGF
jgi:hypothetical protein